MVLAALPLPALALFKVVAPDGSVTYTDRPPAGGSARITTLGRNAEAAGSEAAAALPLELRQIAQRQPVVLYTAPECGPCDAGRALLTQRGVPYSERRVLDGNDTAALERLAGGRTVPVLTIGAQPLRGFSSDEWTAFLDAAGYPRESRLPRGWQPPPPQPLTVRRPPAVAEPPAPAPSAVDPPPIVPGGIRF